MRVLRGKVVSGKVVVEGGPLDEGTSVTVLVPEKERAVPRPRRRDDDRLFEEAEILRDLGGES